MLGESKIVSALVQLSAAGSAEHDLSAAIRALHDKLRGEAPKLVCAFASPAWELELVARTLTEAFGESVVLCSSSAGEFAGRREAKQGLALWALVGDYHVEAGMGRGLRDDPEQAVRAAVSGLHPPAGDYPHRTGIVLLDALTGRGEEAALLTGVMLGPDVPLAGGAAGDDLAMQSAAVSFGSDAASDSVVVAVIHSRQPLGIGIAHGHTPLSGELCVTRSEGGTVLEVNHRPAWDVWCEELLEHAAQQGFSVAELKDDEIMPFLLRFEAGLPVGGGFKIRAPLAKNADGGLTFACGMSEGTKFRIMEGKRPAQVASARRAATQARSALKGREVAGALVFDCICRNLILEEEFSEAVNGVCDELDCDAIAGFETYGEVALVPGDLSGFHNTTTVVLAFPR